MKDIKKIIQSKLNYNPKTGIFLWKSSSRLGWNNKEAGCAHKGYLRVRVNGKSYQLHRLAFLLTHNKMPQYIDHINGDRSDNRIENLREATNSENCINRGVAKNNKSGYKGVSKVSKCKSWQASISTELNGKIYLGSFQCKNYAARVWNTAARIYQGHKFCYTNKIEICQCGVCL